MFAKPSRPEAVASETFDPSEVTIPHPYLFHCHASAGFRLRRPVVWGPSRGRNEPFTVGTFFLAPHSSEIV
jgi:hypothetical protein